MPGYVPPHLRRGNGGGSGRRGERGGGGSGGRGGGRFGGRGSRGSAEARGDQHRAGRPRGDGGRGHMSSFGASLAAQESRLASLEVHDGLQPHQLAAIQARERAGAQMPRSPSKRDWSANRPPGPQGAAPTGGPTSESSVDSGGGSGGGGGGQGGGGGEGGGGGGGVLCFSCGEPGHKARDCPLATAGGGGGNSGGAYGPGSGWAIGQEGGRGGKGKCRGTVCACDTEPGQEHVPVYVHQPAGESAAKIVEHTLSVEQAHAEGRSLLGRHGQFCATFYHMFPVWEANVMDNICLDPTQCIVSHAVVCIGRVEVQRAEGQWQDVYVARYQNCYRGSEKTNYHAEQFLLEDDGLKQAIAQLGSVDVGVSERRRISLYLTYQPCHFSGGHVKNIGKAVTTSCTNRLLKWARETLRPAGITLDVKLAKVVRFLARLGH
jgi:hypothetical protein